MLTSHIAGLGNDASPIIAVVVHLEEVVATGSASAAQQRVGSKQQKTFWKRAIKCCDRCAWMKESDFCLPEYFNAAAAEISTAVEYW